MKLVINGLDNPIIFSENKITTIEILSHSLYSRICVALQSNKGEESIEPYSLWNNNDTETSFSKEYMLITSPLALPWNDKKLLKGVFDNIDRFGREDEELRQQLAKFAIRINTKLINITHQFNAEYYFAEDWEISNYLKCLGFNIELDENLTLLDSLIKFLEFYKDSNLDLGLAFFNLKVFFTEKELENLFSYMNFLEIKILILECIADKHYYSNEYKTTVDQHFLVHNNSNQSSCPSFSQEGICSNGFGAVTF